jgi:hypothetical protein
MSCYINEGIENCLFIVNQIKRIYIANYKPSIQINYNSDFDEIIDIYTDLDWFEIDFNTITIQTDYSLEEELYSTAIKITISEISNELTLYLNERRRFFVLYIDKNDNAWIDGVMPHDNQYKFTNINFEISNEQNQLSFDLTKASPYDIKQISNQYITYNNL